MLHMVLSLILIALVIFMVVAYLQPDQFTITRNARIEAPVETVFAEVNDLGRWAAWSPWARLDPTAVIKLSGPLAGAGATSEWSGNSKVGAGIMRITESAPPSRIRMQLQFFKPMKATNITEFTFTPEGNFTLMRWSMSGRNNFVGKIVNLVLNCDKMVGQQFEQGFANLKAVVEKK